MNGAGRSAVQYPGTRAAVLRWGATQQLSAHVVVQECPSEAAIDASAEQLLQSGAELEAAVQEFIASAHPHCALTVRSLEPTVQLWAEGAADGCSVG